MRVRQHSQQDLDTAAETLCELLDHRAADGRGKCVFLRDGREAAAELSFAQLARRARAVAAALEDHAPERGPAILMYPPGLSFLPALVGGLYAGVIAVPVPPLDPARLRRSVPRLSAIVADAKPGIMLTAGPLPEGIVERFSDSDALQLIETVPNRDANLAMA
jgi:acyl-CoA synthetase (AMP-forming)/AMP-acid ligase II